MTKQQVLKELNRLAIEASEAEMLYYRSGDWDEANVVTGMARAYMVARKLVEKLEEHDEHEDYPYEY